MCNYIWAPIKYMCSPGNCCSETYYSCCELNRPFDEAVKDCPCPILCVARISQCFANLLCFLSCCVCIEQEPFRSTRLLNEKCPGVASIPSSYGENVRETIYHNLACDRIRQNNIENTTRMNNYVFNFNSRI